MLLKLAFVMAVLACVSAQPNLMTPIMTGPSTILGKMGMSTAEVMGPRDGKITVKITMDYCTGLQIHDHNRDEYAMAAKENKGPIKMVFVDAGGKPQEKNVKAGETTIFPAGLMHYQVNYGCDPAIFYATLQQDANTQLTLASLSAINKKDYGLYAKSAASMPNPGFFSQDPTCKRTCDQYRASGGR